MRDCACLLVIYILYLAGFVEIRNASIFEQYLNKGEADMIKRILIPVDGSEFGMKAYEYALEIAKSYDSEIIVLNVQPKHVPSSVELAYDNQGIYQSKTVEKDDANHEIKGEDIAKKAMDYFLERKVKASARVILGDPAEVILETSKNENFDLIIMCTHGMGFTKRFIMGSVTDKVVHHSPIPVFIIR